MKRSICIVIVGPTASGKTRLALELAASIASEIICMDSTTVYKGFDIGSSKPSPEEQLKVPHHLIDILQPDDAFSAHHFVELAENSISDIEQRGMLPIVVGGTYFYLRALQHGMYPLPVIPQEIIESVETEFFDDDKLQTQRMHDALKQRDPEAAEKIHPNDRYRLVRALSVLKASGELPSSLKPAPLSERQSARLWLKYAIAVPRHSLNERIVLRTEAMIRNGLIEETRRLREKYPRSRALNSIGYAEVCQFLDKKLTEKQLRTEIIEKTRQLARRQTTWVRSDPELRFVDHRDIPRILKEVDNLRHAMESEASVG